MPSACRLNQVDFVNRGDLTAQGSLSIDLKGHHFLETSGSIPSTSLAITAGGLRNQNSILAGEKVAELTISGDLHKQRQFAIAGPFANSDPWRFAKSCYGWSLCWWRFAYAGGRAAK